MQRNVMHTNYANYPRHRSSRPKIAPSGMLQRYTYSHPAQLLDPKAELLQVIHGCFNKKSRSSMIWMIHFVPTNLAHPHLLT